MSDRSDRPRAAGSRRRHPDGTPARNDAEHAARPGWKLRLEDRFGLLAPIQILVFRSFGTPDALHLRGRVSERKAVEGTTEESSTWTNIRNTLHRLQSDEIPGARIRARLQEKTWETTTDQEGYFVLDLDPAEPLAPGWHDVELELVESVGEPERRVVHEPVLVPPPDAAFAVVSDLDDTVIRTHSTDLLEMLSIVLTGGAHDRVVIPGIPAFYRALARGGDDEGTNPIFYVSKSGWNLYDLFEEFLDVHDVPAGPLFLSDLRLIEDRSPLLGHERHKYESIRQLLRTYPELPFILIGDSGMKDPELYLELAEQHPGRIRAVYIHDVSGAARDREVADIGERLERCGVSLMRMESVLQGAAHAHARGYISERGLDEVREELRNEAPGGR